MGVRACVVVVLREGGWLSDMKKQEKKKTGHTAFEGGGHRRGRACVVLLLREGGGVGVTVRHKKDIPHLRAARVRMRVRACIVLC